MPWFIRRPVHRRKRRSIWQTIFIGRNRERFFAASAGKITETLRNIEKRQKKIREVFSLAFVTEERIENRRCEHRGGTGGHFHRDRNAPRREPQENHHCRKGKRGGEAALSEGKNQALHELQALLPYYGRDFRRRRVSDGKLSLSYEVGGDLPTLVGEDVVQDTIHYTDGIYLAFGADEHIEGVSDNEAKKDIRKRAIQAG